MVSQQDKERDEHDDPDGDEYQIHVSALLSMAPPSTATTAYRVAQLREGDGIESVECEPCAGPRGDDDGAPSASASASHLRVRAGPFALRRAAPRGAVVVPPALLWCFACLSVECGDEPEVIRMYETF